jgi:predicted DNA-binding protein with PD1-like motif
LQLVDQKTLARGMVRADPGEDLVESLQALAQAAGWEEAYVTGAGVLDLVEIERAVGDVVTLEKAELLSLAGRIALEDGKAVLRLRASVTVGGRSESGRILAAITGRLILVIDAVARNVPAPQVRPATPKPVATPPPRPAPPRDPGNGGALRATAARGANEPPSQSFTSRPLRVSPPQLRENPAVEPGDYLDHPQLGLCEVVGDDESGGTRIRMSSGRVRSLRLDALQVMPAETDGEGRTIFKVAGPRKR